MPRTPTVTRDRIPGAIARHLRRGDRQQWRRGCDRSGSVMINSPEMRRRANHLVNYQDESTLPKKIQELAMLVTARLVDRQFI